MESLRRISIRSRVNAAMALTALTLGLLGGGGYLAVSRAQQDFAGVGWGRHVDSVNNLRDDVNLSSGQRPIAAST